MKRVFRSGVVFLAASVSSAMAQADEASLEELAYEIDLAALLNVQVTTTSKRPERLADAPGVVTVITQMDIRRFGITSLFELMNYVSNVYPVSSYAKRYGVVSFRGMVMDQRNKYNLLLINGRPIKEGLQGGVEENVWASFPVAAIERVEVIRGPGSVLYGPGAFTGVTNIITKTKDDRTVGASVGTGTRWQLRSTLEGGQFSKDDYVYASAGFLKDRGWDWETIERYGVPMRDRLNRQEAAAYLHGGFRGLEMNVFFSQLKDKMWMETPIDQAMNDTTIHRLFIDLGYSAPITPSLNLKANVSFGDKEEDRIVKVVPMATGRSRPSAKDFLGEVTANYSVGQLNLVLGGTAARATAFDTLTNLNPTTLEPIVLPDGNQDVSTPTRKAVVWSSSGYAQADYMYRWLKGVAGVQVNKIGSNAWDLVPRLGLIAEFSRALGAKALFAQAYRAPTLFEMNIDVRGFVGNPQLQSEKITTVDLQVFVNRESVYSALTGYYSRVTDPIGIGITSTHATYVNQSDSLKAYGLEWELKYYPIKRLYLMAAFSYAKADPTTHMPMTMVKLGASYDVGGYATWSGMGFLYRAPDPMENVQVAPLPPISMAPRNNTNLNPNPTQILSIDSFFLIHLSKLFSMTRLDVDAYAKGVNLLDQKVWIPQFNVGGTSDINTLQSLDREPRTIYFGFTARH